MNFVEFTDFHRIAFKLSPNLHELFCKGSKNNVRALANIGNFNTAKTIGKQASIPHAS